MRARLTATIIIATLAPIAALSAQRTVDGWRYARTLTVDSGDGRAHVISTRHIVADGLVRTESMSDNARISSLTKGSYMVISARDSTSMSVLPSQSTAMIMPAILLTDPSFEPPSVVSHATSATLTDLGPGERILGHETHRYRAATVGSVDVTMNGKTCTRTINGTMETWLAADVDLTPMFEMEIAVLGGDAQRRRIDSLHKQAVLTSGPRGLAIRTVRTEIVADSAGRERTIVSTMEYTELEHGPIDQSLFEVPAGFRIRDMRKLSAMTPQRLDSIRRASANPLCRAAR